MIPASFLYPWFDRNEQVDDSVSSTHARRPWLARGREMHFLAVLFAAAVVLGA